MPLDTLEARIDRIESRLDIQELATRYALAVDSRDIDTWVSLFVDDVKCGRYGNGREALRGFIEPGVRGFYRSAHLVCGHVIDFQDADNATGTVYCRAEHEFGDEWIVMAIIYFDTYQRRDGRWYFVKRSERHWYTADVLERPKPPFYLPDSFIDLPPKLPAGFATWESFWEKSAPEEIQRITRQPVPSRV